MVLSVHTHVCINVPFCLYAHLSSIGVPVDRQTCVHISACLYAYISCAADTVHTQIYVPTYAYTCVHMFESVYIYNNIYNIYIFFSR